MVGAILGPVIAGGKSVVGGLIGGLSGKNTDPVARQNANSVGAIVRLGAANAIRYPWGAPAPTAGTFYLALKDGSIWESRAAGFYPVTAAWATKRTAAYKAGGVSVTSDQVAADLGNKALKFGAGTLVAIGLVVWFLNRK